MPPIWILPTQAQRGDEGHCSSAGEDGALLEPREKNWMKYLGILIHDQSCGIWKEGGGFSATEEEATIWRRQLSYLIEGKHHLLHCLHIQFSLDCSYWRGWVCKFKFCPFVRHHFNIPNLGPSNHPRIPRITRTTIFTRITTLTRFIKITRIARFTRIARSQTLSDGSANKPLSAPPGSANKPLSALPGGANKQSRGHIWY